MPTNAPPGPSCTPDWRSGLIVPEISAGIAVAKGSQVGGVRAISGGRPSRPETLGCAEAFGTLPETCVRRKQRKRTAVITPGTILIAKDTLRPKCFHLEEDSYPNAWMSVKHDLSSYELEQELVAAGWTFSDMSGSIRTTAFGFDRARMMHAALRRLITNAKLLKCNCLEIDDVATHSFLGMPYVSVSGHARQLHKSALAPPE
jgi:hypothetical protein